MNIKYFAWIKEITNNEHEVINLTSIKDLNQLKDFLILKYPKLQKHLDKEILRFAVNQEYVVENIELKSNDEIAIFPPVSGG